MPAKAGIQGYRQGTRPWTPACATVTVPAGHRRARPIRPSLSPSLTLPRLRGGKGGGKRGEGALPATGLVGAYPALASKVAATVFAISRNWRRTCWSEMA
jgi:hypothetical protein